MKFLDWNDVGNGDGDGGELYKTFVGGVNRIRIVTPPIERMRKYAAGEPERPEILVAIVDPDDNNALKLCALRGAMLQVIRAYTQEVGDPTAPEAVGFVIVKSGLGRDIRYKVSAGKNPYPIPATVTSAAISALWVRAGVDVEKPSEKHLPEISPF